MARILLVDDDIAEISAVKRVLARGGHQPVLMTNAADALAAVARSRPDLLVIAAACEGGEVLRRFSEDEGAQGVPLLVLGETSAAPSDAAQVARPVDPAQLADQVAASLAAAAGAAPPPGSVPDATLPALSLEAPAGTDPGSATRAGLPTRRRAAAAPDDAARSRRAAAEALRARAEELRRASAAAPPRMAEAEEDPGLEAILRRAEEAERAHAAERTARAREAEQARAEAEQRARRAAEAKRAGVEAERRAKAERARVEEARRAAAEQAEQAAAERVRAEEARRAAAEQAERAAAERARVEEARRAAAERARVEEARRAAAERARVEEARRAAAEQAERAAAERARVEEARRAAAEQAERVAAERARVEEARRAAEEAKRAAAEEAKVRARADEEARAREEEEARRDEQRRKDAAQRERESVEEEARRRLEAELAELHAEVEAERRTSRRPREAPPANRGDGRRAGEDARARDEEEKLRAAIASARAEMDVLRRRGEEEARRRAEAEAEVARLEGAAARRDEADRREQEEAALPAPLAVPVYRPPAEEPRPDPAEEAARRRVAAARERERSGAGERRQEPTPDAVDRRPAAPPPQELRAGTLAELPAPKLLALAARAGVTGKLDLDGAAARTLWLEHGRVVGATSADPGERVEELALRLGLVTREQHRQVANAAVALSSRRCALLLVERGFVKPGELTALVRRRTEEVVFGAFADEGASFRLAPAEVPTEERIQLDRSTLALAVEGVRRRWLAPRVDAVLGGAGTLLAPVPTGPSAEELGLSAEERRALALADGLRTVDEVAAASPLDELSTRQVLAALVLVGALAVRVFQGGRPAAAATTAIDLARVWDKLEQARRADYFTILGVSRRCTPHEVREAAERLSAELDPARFAGVHEEGLEARLDEILGVVADAREILVDDRLRAEYLRGLGE